MASSRSARTRGVVAAIIGMGAAGFVHGVSGGLSIGARAATAPVVAALVTLLVGSMPPKSRGVSP